VVCISHDYCIFSLQIGARCMMLKTFQFKFFCHVKESVRYMNLGRKAIVQIARPPSPAKLLKDSKLSKDVRNYFHQQHHHSSCQVRAHHQQKQHPDHVQNKYSLRCQN
jgi:hypothetical protein